MKISMSQLQPLLREYRILLSGRGVQSMEDTGNSYDGSALVNYEADLALHPYTTFWGTTGLVLGRMGAFSYTHSRLHKSMTVGRFTSIAKGMSVMGARHPHEWASTSPVFYNQKLLAQTYSEDRGVELNSTKFGYKAGKISIGNDVWIGEKVTLGHGITIGDGAVIASNSVVTNDVDPYTVVGGVPARVIRDRFEPETAQALQASAWWDLAPEDLTHCDVRSPDLFAAQVLRGREQGDFQPLATKPLTAQTIGEHLKSAQPQD